jgi:hypothetical protein
VEQYRQEAYKRHGHRYIIIGLIDMGMKPVEAKKYNGLDGVHLLTIKNTEIK